MSTCHALDGPRKRRGPGRRHDGTRRIVRLPSWRKSTGTTMSRGCRKNGSRYSRQAKVVMTGSEPVYARFPWASMETSFHCSQVSIRLAYSARVRRRTPAFAWRAWPSPPQSVVKRLRQSVTVVLVGPHDEYGRARDRAQRSAAAGFADYDVEQFRMLSRWIRNNRYRQVQSIYAVEHMAYFWPFRNVVPTRSCP
jgi:hypothetical protein